MCMFIRVYTYRGRDIFVLVCSVWVCVSICILGVNHSSMSPSSKWRWSDKAKQLLKRVKFIITLFRVCIHTLWQYFYAQSMGSPRLESRKYSPLAYIQEQWEIQKRQLVRESVWIQRCAQSLVMPREQGWFFYDLQK